MFRCYLTAERYRPQGGLVRSRLRSAMCCIAISSRDRRQVAGTALLFVSTIMNAASISAIHVCQPPYGRVISGVIILAKQRLVKLNISGNWSTGQIIAILSIHIIPFLVIVEKLI